MKNTLLASLLFFALNSFAQSSGNIGHIPTPRPTSLGEKKSVTPLPGGDIRGHCVVGAGGSALVAAPCVEVVLVLTKKTGEEVARARTDREGMFEFSNITDGTYKIGSGSRLFSPSKPDAVVHVGQNVELEMVQK